MFGELLRGLQRNKAAAWQGVNFTITLQNLCHTQGILSNIGDCRGPYLASPDLQSRI